MIDFAAYFPFWQQLTPSEQHTISKAATLRHYPKHSFVRNGEADCVGLLLILEGELRAYIVSEEGRELTLYRLLSRDLCLFSASCMLRGMQFDILISAETDTDVLHIPAEAYQAVSRSSAPLSNYTNEIMASRFSDVLWLIDQLQNKKLDARLAAFLLEEQQREGSSSLSLTHEQIA